MTPSLKKRLALGGCFALVLAGGIAYSACAHAATKATDFVEKASIGSQFEISSSRLALSHSQNQDIRNFAQKMIDDHSQLGEQLTSVIALSHVAAAQPSPNLDPKHQKMLDDLDKLSGTDFDKKYVTEQVDGHKETVDLFASYGKKGDNADLKNFANQNLPTIQQHLHHAETLKSSI